LACARISGVLGISNPAERGEFTAIVLKIPRLKMPTSPITLAGVVAGCGEVHFRHPEELMFKKSTRVDAAPIAQPYSEPTARDVRGSPDDAMMGCSEQLQSNARNRNLVCSASLATEAKQETESCNDRTEKNSVRCGDGLGRFGFLRGERVGGDRL
jgi:hypothetical protein